MAKHHKTTFTDESLVVDGNEYTGCRFVRCEIIFAGGSLPTMDSNFFDECRWKFDGPAARAIQFMAALYKGGAKTVIDATIDNIRGKPAEGHVLN
jgi:hypothetical protein